MKVELVNKRSEILEKVLVSHYSFLFASIRKLDPQTQTRQRFTQPIKLTNVN